MKNAFAALAGASIIALAATASAGPRMQLSDWQMDAVTAGSALAMTAFQTSAVGQQTAIQSSVGNIAAELIDGSLAQSRTAVFATGTGNASIAVNVVSQSAAGGQGPAQVATASTAGLASGDTATVQSVGVTTAVSSGLSGYGSIGLAASLANITTFSVSGSLH